MKNKEESESLHLELQNQKKYNEKLLEEIRLLKEKLRHSQKEGLQKSEEKKKFEQDLSNLLNKIEEEELNLDENSIKKNLIEIILLGSTHPPSQIEKRSLSQLFFELKHLVQGLAQQKNHNAELDMFVEEANVKIIEYELLIKSLEEKILKLEQDKEVLMNNLLKEGN